MRYSPFLYCHKPHIRPFNALLTATALAAILAAIVFLPKTAFPVDPSSLFPSQSPLFPWQYPLFSQQSPPFSPQSPQILVEAEQDYFMNPQWSPCGNYIAFTSARYQGIRIVEPGGGPIRVLTDEASAGYGFRWSPDGTRIAARTVRYDRDRFRLHAIKVFDITSGSEQALSDYTRERTGLPYWTESGRRIAFLRDDSLTTRNVVGAGASDDDSTSVDYLYLARDNHIEKYATDTEPIRKSEIHRFDHDRILNLSLSPDRRLLAFQLAGSEIYVMDTGGDNLCHLGRGENPVWMPDGKHLLVTVSEDDGHHITGSDILAVDISTGERYKLTSHTGQTAMNPSVCPEGKRLVFSDDTNGTLYIMTIR